MHRIASRILVGLLSFLPALAPARSPEREVLSFSFVTNVGFGTNLHVVGQHADLGAWAPTNAIKLRWTAGNVWTGRVAVQKGSALEFKYIARSGNSNVFCDPANVSWEGGGNRLTSTPAAAAAPYNGKTIFYYSSWTSASLLTLDGTNFGNVALQPIGPGRTPGEVLYRADGVGEEGERLEFVPHGFLGGTEFWDNPPYTNWQNYFTTLDVFLLQDGHLYNYWPSNPVSAPRLVITNVFSSVPEITSRTVRIYLPRGYDSQPERRYPVLYMQDAQNVYGSEAVSNLWAADAIATREISQGRVREFILAAVDNIANYRRTEYEPPGDTYPGEVPGQADKYLKFLLDNVRPTLDFNFRTLNDRRNTFIGGSSMGGLFSLYAGFETNVFGGLMALSPSITRAPNYKTALAGKLKQPTRIYLDTGSAEGQVGITPGGNYWEEPWAANDILQSLGYAQNEDLLMRVGCGHIHREDDWRKRLPAALAFLLGARDEPNALAQETHPSRLSSLTASGSVAFTTQQHFAYRLQATGVLDGTWSNLSTTAAEDKPWDSETLPGALAPATSFFRVTASPAP